MRYLAWFTGGLLGACLLSAYFLGAFPPGIIASGLALLGFSYMVMTRKRGKIPALLTAGAMVGFSCFLIQDTFVLKPLQTYDGKTTDCMITLLEAPGKQEFGYRADGRITLEGRSYRVRTYLREAENLRAGDRIAGPFTLETAKREEPKSAYLLGEGICLTARGKGNLVTMQEEELTLHSLPGRLRAYGEEIISWCFSPKAAPFARALLLGDTSLLSYGEKWDLRVSGIRHMAAVSGLHVSVLCGLIMMLTLNNKWLTAFLGFPVLLIFAAVTGFSPSVQRASLMMSILLLGKLIDRRYDSLTALSGAVSVMLILNPMTVRSVSFQLSAASVLGILCFYGRLKGQLLTWMEGNRFPRVRDFLAGSLSVSLSSLVFVTPLTMVYFGTVSLIAPVTNLLTVWLIPLIFWGILGVMVLSLVSMSGAMALGSVVSLPISWILLCSHVLAKIPVAAVYTKEPLMFCWVVLTYGLGIFFLRGQSREYRYFLCSTAVSLMICLLITWGAPCFSDCTMEVFDVGQGQCILLSSRGRNFLVDCGGEKQEAVADQVVNVLLSRGKTRLDGMLLTHFDRDHICAADEVLSILSCDTVYVPKGRDLPPDKRLSLVDREWRLSLGSGNLTIFPSENQEVSNEMGLCILFDSPSYDILITGDRSEEGERLLLENHRIPKVDCLIAGHHGAGNSTCQELLEAADPETVIISAGRQNRYGHPHGETLLRLRQFGCEILRTDLSGTIKIRR